MFDTIWPKINRSRIKLTVTWQVLFIIFYERFIFESSTTAIFFQLSLALSRIFVFSRIGWKVNLRRHFATCGHFITIEQFFVWFISKQFISLESLVMMNEVRNFSRPVTKSHVKISECDEKYFIPTHLLTASTPSVTLLVMAPGPQENTPTLLT